MCLSVYSECDWLQCVLPSVVGLRLPFPLLVVLPVLSLSCLVWLLESVPTAVEDGLLRLCELENSVFPVLPSMPIEGSCCSYSEKMTAAETKTDRVPRSHLLDSEIVE